MDGEQEGGRVECLGDHSDHVRTEGTLGISRITCTGRASLHLSSVRLLFLLCCFSGGFYIRQLDRRCSRREAYLRPRPLAA